MPVAALTESHAGQPAPLYMEQYYFIIHTKRTGGGTSRVKSPGLTSAVLTEFFRGFRHLIKANTGIAVYIELNPTHFLPHSFACTVMRHVYAYWTKIACVSSSFLSLCMF